MTRRRTSLLLVATGLVIGGGWVATDELRQPTAGEIAQRACIAEVARTAHQADDDGALAAEAADCTVLNQS